MKKILATILLAAMVCTTSFAKSSSPRARVMDTISEYSDYEGFDLLKIGSLGTALLKSVAKIAILSEGNDPDARQAVSLISGVRSLAIADFDSCSEEDKASIKSRLNRIFRDYEPFMEMKDSGSVVRMYGEYNEKCGEVKDFILYTPSDCALICIFGTISLDKAIQLANAE